MGKPLLTRPTISTRAVRAVLDQISQPLFLWDSTTYSIVGFNAAACDVYRYTRRQLAELSVLELRPASQVESFRRRTNKLSVPADVGMFVHRARDGRDFPVRVYGGPVADSTMLAVVTDLDTRRIATPYGTINGVDRGPDLTPREREVLIHLTLGDGSKEIAEALGISRRTVEAHVDQILAKLGARNRAHAVALALTRGAMLENQASDTT